jgi:hypothetical protein
MLPADGLRQAAAHRPCKSRRELVERIALIRSSTNNHFHHAVQGRQAEGLLTEHEHHVDGVRRHRVARSFCRSNEPDSLDHASFSAIERLFGVLVLVEVDPGWVTSQTVQRVRMRIAHEQIVGHRSSVLRAKRWTILRSKLTETCAEMVGAVLLTADRRASRSSEYRRELEQLFELLLVPVTPHIAEASDDMSADKMPVVDRLLA